MTLSKRIAERMLEDTIQRKADNEQREFMFARTTPAVPFYRNAYVKSGRTFVGDARFSDSESAERTARQFAMLGDRTYAYRIRVIPKGATA